MKSKKRSDSLKNKPRRYARRKGLRKGSKAYNAYVYGTASRRFAGKYRKTHGKK